jgi:hypothetical protein
MDRSDWLAERSEEKRTRLRALAYGLVEDLWVKTRNCNSICSKVWPVGGEVKAR